MLRRIAPAAVISALAAVTLSTSASAGSLELADNFESMSTSTWTEGSTHGAWKTRFDGYGRVGVEKAASKVLMLRPQASDRVDETHAALVTSERSFSGMKLSMRAKTVKQLRSTSPNPWESAWVIWNYKDNTHFYYLALKPNGWEVGKADPNYRGAQRFLATGSNMKFPIGTWADVDVQQVGNTMSVWANGKLLTKFTDNERPYTSGNVGVYNEDAKTYFDNIQVTSL
ncbi:MAG: DUF1080 domain-containing protein [Actinomycetota bacterium]|nr:DUF1080 domain-containing protein [Actinomycetota bacterium]